MAMRSGVRKDLCMHHNVLGGFLYVRLLLSAESESYAHREIAREFVTTKPDPTSCNFSERFLDQINLCLRAFDSCSRPHAMLVSPQ